MRSDFHRMAYSIPAPFTLLLLALLSSALAFGPYGPICRDLSIFPYISCQSPCAPHSQENLSKCRQKAQFGCHYQRCFRTNLECSLDPVAEQNNPCPNGEVQVRNVTLQRHRPVEFDVAVNLRGYTLGVLLLIDASAPRSQLNAIKPELVSLLRKLDGTAKVSVAIYGAEQEFDSSGYSLLAAASDDINPAIQALDNIPQKAEGPRTTLTALTSLTTGSFYIGGFKGVTILIGNAPGREPECSFGIDRVQTAYDMFTPYTGMVVLPVSLGTPGLDAALPAPDVATPERCSNMFIEPHSVAEGQASYLAAQTQGEVIEIITADEIFQAIDRARRTPGTTHQNPPGSTISVSTARFPSHVGPYPWYSVPPQSQTYSNGCEERVAATLRGVSGFVSAPAEKSGKVRLELPTVACRSGPFSCEVRIVERVQGEEMVSHNSHRVMPVVKYNVIKINAC
ncbi:von Willebrand factor A-like protein [Gracilaria domingensis]|nr:von Willebrand factor A-like protein [Gracilaria domingensis]